MQKHNKILFQRNIAIVLIVLGSIGLIASAILYITEPRPPRIISNPKSVSINPAPSSIKPSPQELVNYTVPPNNPKYIAIPNIDIADTPVLKLGVLKSGAIATPDNIYETGWYDGSSLPGQSGAMFIYGHVSSWTAAGIFFNLKKLIPGDKILITTGDNTQYTYLVVSSKIYPYNAVNMQQVLSPVNTDSPGLNLMTCTGQVIPGTSEFSERLVIFTSLSSG